MYIISMIENPKGDRSNALEVDTKMFRVSNSFAVGALIIGGILMALYTMFLVRIQSINNKAQNSDGFKLIAILRLGTRCNNPNVHRYS